MARPRGSTAEFNARRQVIIDEAAKLFARRSYAATGVSEIGEAVNLGRGSLYHYIGSKENLLVAIQDRVLSPLLESAARIRAGEESAMVKLRLLSQTLMAVILANPDHIWVYEHEHRSLTGENRVRFRNRRIEFETIVTEVIAEAGATGVLRVDDLRLATLQFLNLHNHTNKWAKPGMKWDASDLSKAYFRTLMLGQGATESTVEEVERLIADALTDLQVATSHHTGPMEKTATGASAAV